MPEESSPRYVLIHSEHNFQGGTGEAPPTIAKPGSVLGFDYVQFVTNNYRSPQFIKTSYSSKPENVYTVETWGNFLGNVWDWSWLSLGAWKARLHVGSLSVWRLPIDANGDVEVFIIKVLSEGDVATVYDRESRFGQFNDVGSLKNALFWQASDWKIDVAEDQDPKDEIFRKFLLPHLKHASRRLKYMETAELDMVVQTTEGYEWKKMIYDHQWSSF
ncbi:hypothetical protein BGZ60DRAFT_403775 [Tricladium varicosporioides]|nr:hypothetical protein BGZ60DRAFT_403775 [Hymenoscyphus varicosporioides]